MKVKILPILFFFFNLLKKQSYQIKIETNLHKNGFMRSYEILYDKLFRMNKWCCMIGNFSNSLQTQWIGFDSSVQCLWSTYSAIYCYLKSFLISSIDSIKYCTMLAWSPGSMTNDRRTSWITIGPDFLVVNTHTAFWDCFIWR